jgi:hypothetical protein
VFKKSQDLIKGIMALACLEDEPRVAVATKRLAGAQAQHGAATEALAHARDTLLQAEAEAAKAIADGRPTGELPLAQMRATVTEVESDVRIAEVAIRHARTQLEETTAAVRGALAKVLRAEWEGRVREMDAALTQAESANSRVCEIREQAVVLLGRRSDSTIPPLGWFDLGPGERTRESKIRTWRRSLSEVGVKL